MNTALDAVLEAFTWVGVGGAIVFALAWLVLWIVDGTWLPADAVVDHEHDGTWVRWFDGDGEANSARVDGHTAHELAGHDRADIWYRHGWRGRMRLTAHPPARRVVITLTWGLLGLGVVSFAVSMVLLFVPR